MDKILEKIMNFINENTMLLILVCVFLIIILIIYLIDNTIKTKRLEQEELNKKNNPEPTVPEAPKVVEEPRVEEIKEEPKVVEPVTPVVEPTLEPPKVEEIPVEPVVAPVVEEPKVEEIVPETPVIDSSIEELLNKDYSTNNQIVENINIEPVVEPPKVEEIKEEPKVVEPVKSKYKNDKKLSDIFGKKKEEPKVRNIETTQDFSDELDRILQKLNSGESKVEEDTTNYTNMF